MSSVIGSDINSAILSGQFGLQKASAGMSQAAVNIAQRAAQDSVANNGVNGLLADASMQSLSRIKDVLPKAGDSFTSDLISMQLNSLNAQASAKVIDVANDTVGSIIDTLA